ncbi:uncharacterized protein Z520_01391 [Fonsecaea multimorphosa CBS 102226]|uniref:Late sexual development protein n=1 Tax=Fonsecaea multimorphosa CBS 102226 TaxID=1442371 RepID=A0A0D2HM49_9EURO|nr:uncharacterized protein Z520_01391 [Fonsecaea multimorphosa CBS 102226]KIY02926.1 hypothetical protein Z520_01391 [Fonsecaea multimorphosa CBS 102226]OAL30760.1 hypothetical protein AYO22_01380 [Fonsecaea multimorphosa]
MYCIRKILGSAFGCLAFVSPAQAAPVNGSAPTLPSSSTIQFPVGANGPNASVVFPLSNGFPNIISGTPAFQQLTVQAHGSISNAPPPSTFAADDLRSLKVIQIQETFEAYYFTQLLLNITNNVPGFEISDPSLKQDIIEKLTVIQGQEQWHALNAGGTLQHFNVSQIQPCVFKSPATDLASAIHIAANFTAVVISTLQDVATRLGQNGDSAAIGGIVSVAGQEGEQQGIYRTLLNDLVPSELPFLTRSTREFAYSALQQNFIVPGTCPNDNTIDVPIFGTLNVLTTNIQAVDQVLTFSIERNSTQGLGLVYINQQNLPIVETITNPSTSNGVTTFSANFPFSQNSLNGLTIAAVVNSTGPFANANEVANMTLFGPGLIYPN